MKQKLIILITLLSIGFYANAQEYRLTKSNGLLKLNITGVIVEGYDGKEIIFSGQKVVTEESDERAKGLVPITSSKYVDNTGLGINVTESGEVINVNLVAKKPIGVLTIKVPNNIKVSINNNSNNNQVFFRYTSFNGSASNSNTNNTNNAKAEDEIVIKNLKSELEVSVYWNKIRLENNTGPMSVKSVSGSIDAIFTGEIKGPVSIISANSYVDVTLPASTKANIEMGTSYGKLYAGKEFKIDFEKLEPEKGAQNLITSTRGLNRSSFPSRKDNDEPIAITLGTLSSSNDKAKGTGTANKTKNTDTKEAIATVITTSPDTHVAGVQLNGGTHIANGIDYTSTAGTIYSTGYFSGGDRIKGKLNGGGIDLIFKSTNKNVYLRQP